MDVELKKTSRIRDFMFISLICIYSIFGAITAYSFSQNLYNPEMLVMRFVAAILVLVIYLAGLKIINDYEKYIKNGM